MYIPGDAGEVNRCYKTCASTVAGLAIVDCSPAHDNSTKLLAIVAKHGVQWLYVNCDDLQAPQSADNSTPAPPNTTFLGGAVYWNSTLYLTANNTLDHIVTIKVVAPDGVPRLAPVQRTVLCCKRGAAAALTVLDDGIGAALVVVGGVSRCEQIALRLDGTPECASKFSVALEFTPASVATLVLPDGQVVVAGRDIDSGRAAMAMLRLQHRNNAQLFMTPVHAGPAIPKSLVAAGAMFVSPGAPDWALRFTRRSMMPQICAEPVVATAIPAPCFDHVAVGDIEGVLRKFDTAVASAALVGDKHEIAKAACGATLLKLGKQRRGADDRAAALRRAANVYDSHISALEQAANRARKRKALFLEVVAFDHDRVVRQLADATRGAPAASARAAAAEVLCQEDHVKRVAVMREAAARITKAGEDGWHPASSAAKRIRRLLRCDVCTEFPKQKRQHVAPCGHWVCIGCHRAMLDQRMVCPICRGPLGEDHPFYLPGYDEAATSDAE
ncbi:hypothetical protein [Nereida ignava]|uniref:hypothetical protein n=1 Tax=Nereida ignava TaxID=282199 RepID=UPI0030FB37D0